MKRLIILTIYCLVFIGVRAQDPAESWNHELLRKANTAQEADYLTKEEKQVILITNLVRLNGELFAETFLDTYLEGQKPTKYTRSLYRELKNSKDLPVFYPEKDLYSIAYEHALTSGKRGTVGHQRFQKRFNPLMGKYTEVAENCAYGYEKAIDIVIQLLIDEDIPDLGHRKNLLNPNLNSIGVSIQPHKNFRYNCVMDFGATNR